jgi:hypothetical protein
MANKETVGRWTVPQVSVWIRTRDLATVRELGPRTARSLVMAALAMPDVLTASECLVAALRAGRLAASGRLVAAQVTATGKAPDRILGDGRESIPQSFWQDGADLSDDPDRGVMARAHRGEDRWIDLDVEAGACIGRWQPPAAILGDGALSLGQAAAQLDPEPIDRLRWLLTHPAAIVTGLNDRAERVTVDAAALALGVADIEADSVTTRDGRLCWSQVTIDLAPAAVVEPAVPQPETPPPDPPLRKIDSDSQTALCRANVLEVFPDGKWSGSYAEILARIEAKCGRSYSQDVLRVALGTKKP